MFRIRCVNSYLRRFLHGSTINRDQVLERLRVCSVEDQVFDVVSKNKAKFTEEHVSCAVGMLWQFQKEKPSLLRTTNLVKGHPEFLTLCVLAENKISLMDDVMLVDILYAFLRLNVEPHNSLVQQIVSEAWLRLDRLPMTCLSKFAVCLNDQHLQLSPLMGRITDIVDQRLSSIDDARILSALMTSVSSLVSPRLRDALISRADQLLDTMSPKNSNVPRRLVQFLRNIKYTHRPLLEKCNKILLQNISQLEVEYIGIILGLYQSLQFNNCDFRVASKQQLIELMDSCTDPYTFTKIFVALAPMASLEIRERLENTALLLADEFSAPQALAIAEALEESQSRNLSLLNKVASVIQKNIDVFKSGDLARVAQTLSMLQYHNPEFLTKLRNILVNYLQHSFSPFEVTLLTRVLSMLPSTRVEESVISRVVAIVAQCNLNELSTISAAVTKWARTDPTYYQPIISSKYVSLQQTLNQCGYERLQTADQLDLLLDELKYITGDWFEEILLEETIATLQRMMDQITWTNSPDVAFFLTRINHFSPPLMDKIANVTLEHIDKIHYSALYAILLPFSVLNYDTVQADELYDACIKHFTPHISSFDPHLLVLLAYCLAVADHFPEELIREIFSIDFLGKLDSQLETVPDALNMRTRMRLMELNRAVCLECPEFQVPWFHERYCQQMHKGNSAINLVQQQIHKILGEVLGGINCVQMAVVTPYFYTIDFECKLDKHMQPLPYSEPSALQLSDKEQVQWKTSSLEKTWDELPPGAQRVAVDFLDSRSFCKNSHHIKGETLMKKRHLEILGYRVIQIPHFEWNSMELSTHDAWKEYLKNKILT